MNDLPPITLVCCDLTELVLDASVVERAFAEAIATQGIVAGTQDYARAMVRFDKSRGRPPAAVLRELFDGDALRAAAASIAFDRSFRAAAERFGVGVPSEVADVLGKVAGSGAKVCLLSVLSKASCGQLLAHHRLADLVLCADDSARGFPWPDPVLTAMLRLGTADVREVAVISATEDGVLSGYRAGARLVIGVGGGRRAAALHDAGATHVADSIGMLADLLVGLS
jgi:beta-phosphoglucomutase-like phosphatase (HAD superfamily)